MVLVYILADDPRSPNVEVVRNLFSNNYFTVGVVSSKPNIKEIEDSNSLSLSNSVSSSSSSSSSLLTSNSTSSNTNNSNTNNTKSKCENKISELEIEYHRVTTALTDVSLHHPDEYVILVKDTSISIANPETIAEVVSTTKHSGVFDICYLCKWLDRCDLYTDKKAILDRTSLIVKTQSPNGIQAIMFSPNGREIVLGNRPMNNKNQFELKKNNLGYSLNQEILKGHIDAICLVPNLINHNPTLARSNEDYVKNQECASVHINDNNSSAGFGFWWMIIILIVLIIIIWGIFKLKNNYIG